MDVTISIVTYNSEKIILDTLKSIYENISGKIKFELIIVDNSSLDSTVEIIEKNYKNAIVLNSPNNGFGHGHNKAIKQGKGKYHLIYNPDLLLKKNVVEELFEYMEENEEVVVTIPKVIFPDGKLQTLCRRNPTLFDAFSRKVFPDCIKNISIIKKRMEKYDMLDNGYEKKMEVEFISGAFMFCRKKSLEKVNGFDERYFMYYEDADLTRKLSKLGKAIYYPYVDVIHLWERGAYKNKKLQKIMIQSMFKYFNKWGWKVI